MVRLYHRVNWCNCRVKVEWHDSIFQPTIYAGPKISVLAQIFHDFKPFKSISNQIKTNLYNLIFQNKFLNNLIEQLI